jgi:plastocyanin
VTFRRRQLVIGAACVAVAAAPAYALQGPPSSATVTATDTSGTSHAWVGGTVTIAKGGTVTFEYPSGSSTHSVRFTDDAAQPTACSGLPSAPSGPGWSGSCRFDSPGTYPFACPLHPSMTGTITVSAPSETAPTVTPSPGGGPTATATPQAVTQPPLKDSVSLARSQKGTRVRGSVAVAVAGSRLAVEVWVPRRSLSGGRSTKPVRIGRYVRASAPAGRDSFAVGIDTKGRSALRRHRRLAVTVRIALTPPGSQGLTFSGKSTLRMGY